MEAADSDYTVSLRRKYEEFLQALNDENEPVFGKFHDRLASFEMVSKQCRESTAQAVIRHADDLDADFVCVGTNVMRTDKDPCSLHCLSMQICLETSRNFMVSTWVDISGRLFDEHVRAPTPEYVRERQARMMIGATGRKDD
eukprot:TRINITY_DN21472_c0_g1_i4.p1 TRINITY_DN21472_c0_g1~~TRINITY_DN21472_c0_g1_i4.p1  ORF type:complete len:142 (-),score=28.52 TRINITY_DN21472_c0_g1_i4:82-507(-)